MNVIGLLHGMDYRYDVDKGEVPEYVGVYIERGDGDLDRIAIFNTEGDEQRYRLSNDVCNALSELGENVGVVYTDCQEDLPDVWCDHPDDECPAVKSSTTIFSGGV